MTHQTEILVRAPRPPWPVMVFLVGLMGIGSVVGWLAYPPIVVPFLVAGAVMIVLGVPASFLWWHRELRRRLWVVPRRGGFDLVHCNGDRRILDVDIVGLAIRRQNHFLNGDYISHTRTFTVWLERGGPALERVVMVNVIPAWGSDPLADLITRLHEKFVARARDGEALDGVGWQFRQSTLTWRGGTLALDDLIEAVVVDNDLCCWIRGRDHAVFKTPIDSVNAFALWMLLDDHLRKIPFERTEPPDSQPGSLGPILFERRTSRRIVGALVALAVLLLAGGFFLAFGAPETIREFALLSFAGAVIPSLMAFHGSFTFLRCHSWGIRRRTLFANRMLRYRDVEGFRYSAFRHYHNGAYTGSLITLSFIPFDSAGMNEISFSVSAYNWDTSIESLRDQISQLIADRLHSQLRRERIAPWTSRLVFLPGGLEHRPMGWRKARNKNSRPVLPYQNITHIDFEDGMFRIWANGDPDPVAEESCDEDNFYPGYVLLQRILDSPSDPPPETAIFEL